MIVNRALVNDMRKIFQYFREKWYLLSLKLSKIAFQQ